MQSLLILLGKIFGNRSDKWEMVQASEQLTEAYNQLFPHDAEAVSIGQFVLADSPALALKILQTVADSHGLPGYADFLEMHQTAPAKPSKPTNDENQNILYKNPPPIRNEKERRFFERALETLRNKEYFDKFSDYEKKQTSYQLFKKTFTPDVRGYISFICEENEAFSSFFFEQYKTLPISEESRKRHTYIVGGSGSGKSELMKAFLYHYLTRNTKTAVVLLEPHGKLSREVSRWPELQGDRLAYIRPGIDEDKTPVFNPFDISEDQRKNPRIISVLVGDTIDVLAEILERDFTYNMETLLRACLNILYNRAGSTFLDVIRFVDTNNNADLIEAGKKIFPVGSPLYNFVANELNDKSLGPTRQAIKMRLTSVLSGYFVSSFLIGKSTFDLDELLSKKKFVVFNLATSDIGKSEARIFGKLILSHIKAFGFRQGKEEYSASKFVPVHVFVDECHEFITASIQTIAEEARKFGIHLTLAQQSIGRGMSKELETVVLTNTEVKITGKNSDTNIRRFCAETGTDPESLEKITTGQFCIKSGALPPVIIKTPAHRLDSKGAVAPEVWENTWEGQKVLYYAKRSAFPEPAIQQPPTQDKAGFNVAKPGDILEIDY